MILQMSRPTDSPRHKRSQAGRLGDQLCFALYAATNAMTRTYRPLLTELDITYPQYLVLLVLWERDGIRLGEIAEELYLATHAVSPIIDRLEEAGLVQRETDVNDARSVRVVLTKAGRAMESDAAQVQEAVRCHAGLSSADITELRTHLRVLTENLLAE